MLQMVVNHRRILRKRSEQPASIRDECESVLITYRGHTCALEDNQKDAEAQKISPLDEP